MQGWAGTRTRIAIGVVICLAAASVLAGSSNAIPRKRAVAIALKALAPSKVKGSVVVYGLCKASYFGTATGDGTISTCTLP